MILAAALALALVTPADTDAPIFAWVDSKGTMHATDRLADVPEPWFSAYSAKLKELEERRKNGTLPPEPPPEPARTRPTPTRPVVLPTTQDEAARRQAWKATMRQWRVELAEATADLQDVQNRIAEARMNPILALTPAVKARVEAMRPDEERAQKRVETARQMLMDVLPKRARDEHVPPLWLM